MVPDVGPNVEFYIEATVDGPNTFAFDVPGAVPAGSATYTLVPGQSSIPNLIITPKRAGAFGFKFVVTELIPDGNGGWMQDPNDPAIKQFIGLEIVST